jgi:hypothetical protein
LYFQGVLEDAVLGSQMLPQRRCSKNSGGGIAPAAIGGLIEGEFCTVNAFRTPEKIGKSGQKWRIRC